MPYPSEVVFRAASDDFILVINGCVQGLQDVIQAGHDVAAFENLNGFEPYQAAKQAYVVAFQASLLEIGEFQTAGIAHYNPAYLEQAHAFLGSVMGGELDHISQIPQLLESIVNYSNLYNTGRWQNILTWLQKRALGNYRSSFAGWFTHGAIPNQPVDINLTVLFTKNGQQQSASLKVGIYWPLLNLKGAIKDNVPADGNTDNHILFDDTAIRVTALGSGLELTPDTKALTDFGLHDGDQVAVNFPAPGSPFGIIGRPDAPIVLDP